MRDEVNGVRAKVICSPASRPCVQLMRPFARKNMAAALQKEVQAGGLSRFG